MTWVLFSLVSSWFYCAQSEINKHYKIDGFRLNTARSFFAVILMLPLVPFMEWPAIPAYYLVVILEGAISVVGMMVQYNLAARHNGRVACLHQPISIMLIFVFWLVIDPSQRAFLLENPMKCYAIIGGFILFAAALQFIRKGDMGIRILMAVFPVAVLYSLMSVISKIALESGTTLFQISLNFVFLSNLAMFALSMPVLLSQNLRKRDFKISKDLLVASSSIAFFHTVCWVFAAVAVILTPNPAYPAVLGGLTPLWFLLYYKIRKIRDDANPIAGLAVGLAAIIIIVAAQ